MHARESNEPMVGGNGAGPNGSASRRERNDPASSGVERELTEALHSARSAASEAFDLARLELKRLRARGRNTLLVLAVGLWLGVALLAATWAAGSMALRGLASGLNRLFNSAWIGELVAPALLFAVVGGALLLRWRALDRKRAGQLGESHNSDAVSSTPPVSPSPKATS